MPRQKGREDYVPVLMGNDFEEIEARNRIEHPEWFDENGERLPTAVTGVRAPGGFYVPIKGNSNAETGKKTMPEEMGSNIPLKWKPTLKHPVPPVRCLASTKAGKQCGRWSIRGGTLCYVHGGLQHVQKEKADSVIRAARIRMLGLTGPAIDVLEDLITNNNTADAIRLKAAQDILDRTGLKAPEEVLVEVTHKNSADEIEKRLRKLAEISQGRDSNDLGQIEMEVVEDVSDTDGDAGTGSRDTD